MSLVTLTCPDCGRTSMFDKRRSGLDPRGLCIRCRQPENEPIVAAPDSLRLLTEILGADVIAEWDHVGTVRTWEERSGRRGRAGRPHWCYELTFDLDRRKIVRETLIGSGYKIQRDAEAAAQVRAWDAHLHVRNRPGWYRFEWCHPARRSKTG